MHLENNQIVGNIPEQIGNLTNLHWLRLENNQLSGEIPSQIGNLINLEVLYIYNNQLTGAIPAELNGLSNLEELVLFNNQIDKNLADLSGLNKLENLFVCSNALDFGDLETMNVNWSNYPYHCYGSQRNVKLIIDNTSNTSETSLQVNVGGTGNQYQWFNNDSPIDGATSNSLQINNDQTGMFYCRIVNPNYPELILYSEAYEKGVNLLSHGIYKNEYDALVAFYNSTDGNNWKNNTFWLTDSSVVDWYGISTEGFHISGIILEDNQLNNKIPSDIANLSDLQYLVLNDNQLTENEADLSGLSRLSYLYVYNNKFDFGDLDRMNVDWSAIPIHSYNPQDSVELKANQADNTTLLTVNVGGLNNQYQWYKDGNKITGATGNTYVVNDYESQYYCKITNPDYPELTLTSQKYKYGQFNVIVDISNNIIVYPNPTHGELTIDAQKGKISNLFITDLNGRILYEKNELSNRETINVTDLPQGIYIMRVRVGNVVKFSKIVKE